jgi:2-iminobutanoate/2-iminopropanoate deaminase
MNNAIFHLLADAPRPVAPYSHVVEIDGWLFVTGQIASEAEGDPLPEGIEAQTKKVLENLRGVLEDVGAGLENVVAVRAFLVDFERDYALFNRVYASCFAPDRLPARTTIGVTGLARGGLVEIDMIARRSDG